MAFQSGAFQGDAFQIPVLASNSGGYRHGYADALNNADRLRRRSLEERVESLPEVVRDAIVEVSRIDSKPERDSALLGKVEAETKFLRLYLVLLERYRLEIIETELAERIRQENDDMAMILLLSV